MDDGARDRLPPIPAPGSDGVAEAPAGRGWSIRIDAPSMVVVLTGDWLAREMTGAEPEAVHRILDCTGADTIAFDATGLGHWDSALLVFLSAIRRGAQKRALR